MQPKYAEPAIDHTPQERNIADWPLLVWQSVHEPGGMIRSPTVIKNLQPAVATSKIGRLLDCSTTQPVDL